MARDVNASINKCEKAIAQEEKNISEAKEKIRKLRKEMNNQFASDLLAAIMKDGDISDEKRKEILAMLSKSEAKNFGSQNEKTTLPEGKIFNGNDL